MDYNKVLQMAYETFRIPVVTYDKNWKCIKNYFFKNETDYFSDILHNFFDEESMISYFVDMDGLFWGYVNITNIGIYIIIGPVSPISLDQNIIYNIMRNHIIHKEAFERVSKIFIECPRMSQMQFLSILSSFYYQLTGAIMELNEITNINNVFPISADIIQKEMLNDAVNYNEEAERELNAIMNSYEAEVSFLKCLEQGTIADMKRFLSDYKDTPWGLLGDNPLRHYKNGAISLECLSARAAISGGLPPKMALKLSSLYIQDIERSDNSVTAYRILVDSIFDYMKRIEEIRISNNLSPIVRKCVRYIESHICMKLHVSEIAEYVEKSPSYISMIFKRETGITLVHYIERSKIREAKKVLAMTNKTLAEISNYLGFSSQSYFQNIFKKVTNTTPLEYRKNYL